jgi:hypothetical protein
MALGRLALGTGWSGNLDFMTPENALLVNYGLVKVKRDEYPHWQKQSWAEPDVEHAFSLLKGVLDDPDRGRAIAERGRADVLRTHGNRAVGLRILAELERIAASGIHPRPPAAKKPQPPSRPVRPAKPSRPVRPAKPPRGRPGRARR